MKRLLLVSGIVLGVLIVAALAIPLFINVDAFRPELEQKLSAALNRPVHIGKLEASILSGGASAENISIDDDPAFNKGPFLQASALKVGVRLMPLILSRRLEVTSVTVQKPNIVLLKNAAGKWNYATLGTGSPAKANAKSSSSTAAELSIDKFEIVNGKVSVGQSSGHAGVRERTYQNVNLVARNISVGSVMPFTLSAVTPGGGALDLDGYAGPLDRTDSERTPLDANLNLKHADLGATGFLDPGSGLGGTLDFQGSVKSDGKRLHSEGKAKANGLKLVKGASPAKAPVLFDYASDYGLDSDAGTIKADFHTGNSTATARGTVEARGEEAVAHLKLQGKDMAVGDVEGLLPAFGVVLPAGASLKGGVINVDMAADGPLDRLVITGPLNISNTHLSGYNLTSKLGAVAALAGLRPSEDTLIQTLSSGLRVAPEGLRADNLVLDVPSIGSLTGNGVIGNDNALDFQMLMKLSNTSGSMLGNLGGFSQAMQSKGIPFLIHGKTSSPVFLPAPGGLKNALENVLSPGTQSNQGTQQQQGLKGLLDGLVNKKKPQ
jgi:AsmA protein